MSITNIEFADGLVIFINDNDKPLTTEPPLSPPDTEEDVIEWKRYKMYKQGLLEEEQLHDSLNAEHELELEQQAMQWLDDDEDDDWCMPFSESIERKD